MEGFSYGSAVYGKCKQGLDFFHVVEENEDRFKLLTGFDNYGIFTIEEVEMDQDNTVKNMRALFAREWNLQPKKLDEFSFLVRFPSEKKWRALSSIRCPISTCRMELSWHL
jgi:hypothetical protein